MGELSRREFLAKPSLRVNRGAGGKELTMTMTPWNLPHGQWPIKITMTPSVFPMVNGQYLPILTI